MSDDLFHENSDATPNDSHNQTSGSELVPVSREQSNQPGATAYNFEHQKLEGLAQELLELKLAYLSETNKVNKDVSHLRGHIYWLTVALVGAIAIASGVISWLSFSLRSNQARLVQQVEAIATESIAVERIEQVESQLDSLSNRFPERIVTDVQTNQDQLQELETRIADVADQVNTRRETISILARALQDLINEEDQRAIAPARENATNSPLETEDLPPEESEDTPQRDSDASQPDEDSNRSE
ncbi:MAG: hypothetical protein ACFE0J_09930 [Elainellaceae cyanobacterium]